jgi:hypothetical protein
VARGDGDGGLLRTAPGGDRAALLAVAALAGCAFVSSSYRATLDFRSAPAHAVLREDMAAVARAAATGDDLVPPISALLEHVLGAARGGLF